MENKLEEEIKISKAWGIAALVTSILSIFPFAIMPYIGLPLAIFSLIAVGLQKKRGLTGFETAATVLASIGIMINLIMLVFVAIALMFVGL